MTYEEKTHVPIAICGYSYRMPGGIETDEDFWNLLASRGYVQNSVGDRYGKGEIPWDGFTESPIRVASLYEGHIQNGRELEFDCAIFGVSMHDAKRMDPQIKMMLMATWEALQCAGMDQAALHNSNTGVFTGHQASSAAGWRALYGAQSSDVPGKSGSMIANRISFHFNWMGPSFSVATACSSGITALDAAVKSLDKGECDLAAFGAVHYLGHLQSSVGFNALGIVSKDGCSRSFDKDASGYMRSEGAFMYIIKRLEDAERDGDRIFGVIRGCGLNTAGAEEDAEIMTQGRMIVAPVRHAQQALMAKIVQQTGVDPTTIDYVEAHATGTVLGDATEGNAIANVYGSLNRTEYLRLSSCRSNIGHMEAASFTCSLLKVLLMLQKRKFLPVSSHHREATEKIPFEAKKMRVQTEVEDFPEGRDRPVRIGINSFGFGGANGHCLIEEYRMPQTSAWSRLPEGFDGKVYTVPLSAKSEEALIENVRLLNEKLVKIEEQADFYTLMGNLSTRMTHHRIRTAFTATNYKDFKEKLTAFTERAKLEELKEGEIVRQQLHNSSGDDGNQSGNLVMVFPGQGSQWAGCGKELYDTDRVFRSVVDTIDTEWMKLAGCKLSEVAFDKEVGDKLNDCYWAQPVTFMLQAAMFEMFKAHGIHPKAILGHSAGEASAAYASGAYTLEEACFLVYHRSRLQNELAGCGRMLVLMMNGSDAQNMLKDYGFDEGLEIACYNSPGNTVVCGSEDIIMQFREKLEADGKPQGTLIPGNIAFHSRHMLPIQEKLYKSLGPLDGDEPRTSKIPMISTVTGKPIKKFDAEYWWTNVRMPVNLLGAMTTAHNKVKPEVMIEISPHITLRSPIRDYFNDQNVPLPNYVFTLVRNANSAEMFAQSIGNCFKAGLPVKFSKLYPRPCPITHLLPPYYMKRERVIDPTLDDKALTKKECHSAGPLLGMFKQSEHLMYEAVFSKRHFSWMADHVVQGQPLVPAAAYLELLFEAFKGEPIDIVSLRVLAPFVLTDNPANMYTELVPCHYAPHRYEAKIYSRIHGEESDSNTIHCLGVVEKINGNTIDQHLPETLYRNIAEDTAEYKESWYDSRESFYSTMLARIGHSFSYGPYFQGVCKVDFDREQFRMRMDVKIDADLWSKWDQMGYIIHPSMMDGALQSFLALVVEASDFSGIPQMIKNLVLVSKPSSEHVIVIYEPPEYLRGKFHHKGQLSFALGERSAGHCEIYDGKTGNLVAHLGDYTSHGSNSKKADMRKVKHYLSWQPKDDIKAAKMVETIVPAFESGSDLCTATETLIREIINNAHPTPNVPFFLNIAECIIGEAPEKLAMEQCVASITNAPVQYSLLSADTDMLTETYQKLGTSNQEANLRFVDSNEEIGKGFLRPSLFELLVVRIGVCAAANDDNVDTSSKIEEEYQRLSQFVAPGGMIIVENAIPSLTHPVEWATQWTGSRISIFKNSGLSDVVKSIESPLGENEEAITSPVLVSDSLGFAEYWKSVVCPDASTEIDFDGCKSWTRIDYFAMQEDGNELYDSPAKLTEFVKEMKTHRESGDNVAPCILTVYTSGAMLNVTAPTQTAVWGAVRTLSVETGDVCNIDYRVIDVSTKEDLRFVRNCESMRERELCIHNGRLWTARLINKRQPKPLANLPADDESIFRLHTDNSGLIADIEFHANELPPLAPHEVEVLVKASALNFRDIMVGLDRLPLLSYEASMLGRTVGMECAGEVVRCGEAVSSLQVGDKVLAMQGGCISNRIRCHEKAAYPMPSNLTFEQGSSTASVYVTAYYALIYLARMREGQTVLVHSAMGGVGQAAIALTKLMGVKIYGTAGSEAKRQALREKGCVDAFDSHSTSWYHDLMKATKGRGVDIVLNSLAGEHVDLCLEALAPGGWHCEIGKVDIFADRPMKLSVFRKNIAYRAIDVDRLMTDDPLLTRELTAACLKLIEEGKVPPLPCTVYKYQDYQDAFRCMMNGQHQGKLVLTPPGPGETVSVVDNRPIFGRGKDGSQRTVLMSGCLGGFGLRLLAYVIAMGAKNVILLDRDSERKRTVEWVLDQSYISYLLGDVPGLRLEIVYADVGEYDHVIDAVSAVDRLGMPPIGSVFHLAGILDDKFVSDIDRESFAKVYKPKVNGAWNLHLATLDIETIDHFVMFSSTSSAFGNPGQTNYSAANSFQDGLAAMRMQSGKPGLSFCMGAVIEAGMAARSNQLLQMMKSSGMPAISCIFAIEVLDDAIRCGNTWNAVAALAHDLPANVSSTDFLRTYAQLVRNNAAFKIGGGGSFSKEALVDMLSKKVATLCGVETLDPTEPFSSYGLNSISVAEMAGYLKNEMNYTVSAMELMTSATCESIADGILKAHAGDDSGEATDKDEDEDTANTDESTDDGDDDEDDQIWFQQITQERSRFEPELQAYFNEPVQSMEFVSKQILKPVLKQDNGKVDTETNSISDPSNALGKYEGSLPKPVQETLDALIAFTDAIDVSDAEDPTPVKEMKRVVLTGATGFVGRHFLADLLNETSIAFETIYCPVRAKDDDEALERLVKAMTEAGTWNDAYRPRLCVFKADLEDESLGTSMDLYDEIVQTADAVYHLASNLNLAAPFDDISKNNCTSMRSILRVCLTFRLKHLFHASTLGIFPQYFCQFANEMGSKPIKKNMMPDVSLMKKVFPLITGGYPWSKFINEIVVYRAAKTKRLPLAVFRLPVMFANTSTGYSVYGDPLVTLFYASLQLRLLPGKELPFVTEDSAITNEMMLRVSLNPNRKNVVYHCSSPSTALMTEASLSEMMGFPCEYTTYENFKSLCMKLGSGLAVNAYWLLIDHFKPYWIGSKKSCLEYPIDKSTIMEDFSPIIPKANSLKVFTKSLEWVFKHDDLPLDRNTFIAATDVESIVKPGKKLCDRYGLDFNQVFPPLVMEGIHRICDELHSPKSMLPEVAMYLTSRVETRVHLYSLIKEHPEILEVRINAPLFVLGLNRTGTTFLHRVLEASGRFEAPHLEDQVSLPKAEQMANPKTEDTRRREEFLKAIIAGYASSAEGIHEIELGVGEEDMCAHSASFLSLDYDVLFQLPKYRKWLESLELDLVYEEHRMWTQTIAWQRYRTNPNCNDRWVYKFPWHLRSLPQLLKVYPDARFVCTHRDLDQVAGSWCSLVERQRERFVENIDRKELGKEQVQSMIKTLTSGVQFRQNYPEYGSKWLDVDYADIVSQPIDTANRVLAHAGIPVVADTTDRMKLFVEENLAKREGIVLHQHDYRHYGLEDNDFYSDDLKHYQELRASEMDEIPDLGMLEEKKSVS